MEKNSKIFKFLQISEFYKLFIKNSKIIVTFYYFCVIIIYTLLTVGDYTVLLR